MPRARPFAWRVWRRSVVILLGLTLAAYAYSVLGSASVAHYATEKHSLSLSRGCVTLGWTPAASMPTAPGAMLNPGPASAWSFESRFRSWYSAIHDIGWWFEFHKASSVTKVSGSIINRQSMTYVLPLWAPTLAIALVMLLTWRRHARVRARYLKSGRCPRCLYSRAGLLDDAACPECGDVPGERELAMIAARL